MNAAARTGRRVGGGVPRQPGPRRRSGGEGMEGRRGRAGVAGEVERDRRPLHQCGGGAFDVSFYLAVSSGQRLLNSVDQLKRASLTEVATPGSRTAVPPKTNALFTQSRCEDR